MRLLALLPLLFALAAPAHAGVERWTSYGPPEGHLVTLAIDGDHLYAASELSGVYASADRGLTWFRSSNGLGSERVEALAIDPDDHAIYAAGQRRFFRSTDQGAHWTVLGPLPTQEEPGEPVNELLTLVPGEPGVFFLSIGKVLYRSTDGGRAWAPVLTWTTAILSILIDPNDSSSIFVGTVVPESRLLHSPDGGATWTPVTSLPVDDSFPFPFGVSEIAAAATTPTTLFALSGGSLYRSRDAGVTWRKLRIPRPSNGGSISVVATPGQHPRIYSFQYTVDTYSPDIVLFASDDLGDTWVLSTAAVREASLRVDPVTGALFSFDPGGVGIAEEEGAPWRYSPLGAAPAWHRDYFRPIPKVRFARGRTYVVVGGRLWVSRDGQSWTALARDLVILDVVLDPRPGVLWAATYTGVHRSNDGGITWNLSLDLLQVPYTEYGYDHQAVTQLDSHTLLFSGHGILRSGDRGATWKKTLSGVSPDYQISDRYVDRVRVEPGNPKIVYAESSEILFTHPPEARGYVYQSLDGGLTWRRLSEDVYSLALHPTQPQTLYGFGRGGLLRSSDRGRHWTKISDGLQYAFDLVFDPTDPRILYAAANGVWRSVDGGVTWAPLRIGLNSLPTYQIFPDPRRPGRLFVASEGFFTGSFALPGEDGAQSVYDGKAYGIGIVCAHPGGASWSSRPSVSGLLQH